LLTEDCLKNGFTDLTRIRILIKAGFWEESWGNVVSTADARPGKDFGYQPFEEDDSLDLSSLLERLRNSAQNPAFAFVWGTFSEHEKEKLNSFRELPGEKEMKYSPSEATRNQVKSIVVARFNNLMDGSHFHTPERFEGVSLRRRTADLLEVNPSGPNLRYLNRLMLEDLCPMELARRQTYPPNGLRRSGMSAVFQVFEDKDYTINYFSTGGESWEGAYKSSCSKQEAREHLQVLYGVMNSEYSDEDRKDFLPKGHKLDDFRTPGLIAAEQKNKALAETFLKNNPPVARSPFYNKKKTKYSPEEKAKWVSDFRTSGMNQHQFAETHGLVYGVFHKWLENAGATTKARTKEEIAALIEKYKARPSGLTKEEFAESVGIPFRTFWTLLQKAGLTKESVKHTPEEIAQLLEAFKVSGMTRTDYAKSIHVDRVTFLRWLESAGIIVDGKEAAVKCESKNAPIVEEIR
jgi:predicted DNA-binding protein (UPF0251 family)